MAAMCRFGATLASARSGMYHKIIRAERDGPDDFLAEGLDGARSKNRARRSEIDQIISVDDQS